MTPHFVLFVTGHGSRSSAAATDLRALCDERLGEGRYRLEIVDVLEEPDRADAAKVLATPTVVRLVPIPRRRVIGDLSTPDSVAVALGLPGQRLEESR